MTPHERILKALEPIRTRVDSSAPGPYSVERVDHEPDEITYEISTPGRSFHLKIYESDCLDVGVSAKNQADLYAHSRTDADRLEKALKVLAEVCRDEDALEQAAKILEE